MNRNFEASLDVSPAALAAVVRQAHADRAAFVATILIGFGKRLKDLVAGTERGATRSRRMQGRAA